VGGHGFSHGNILLRNQNKIPIPFGKGVCWYRLSGLRGDSQSANEESRPVYS
jgi:hypothetical protein